MNICAMSPIIFLLVLQLLAWRNSNGYASARERIGDGFVTARSVINVGVVLDLGSRMGKEQKIAMEIAVQDFNRFRSSKLLLNFHDSRGNSASTVAAAVDLALGKQVEAIVGTITHKEAILAIENSNTKKNLPILSLTSPAVSTEPPSIRLPYFIKEGTDIILHIRCLAAIVGEFRFPKVTAIYEHNNGFPSDPGILTLLSYSLRLVGSEIDDHLSLPPLSSLPNPKFTIEKELSRLKSNSNRVFLIVQSSLEMASLLFEKAKRMGMMKKGSVWIVTDEVAGLIDSVNSSVILNMQGVIGFRTHFNEISETLRQFKFKFRRNFALEYPEEENPNPSIFALRSYDATWAIAQAAKASQGKISQKEFSERILTNNFEGLSGKFCLKNGTISRAQVFKLITVIGKNYIDLAFWSPAFGFSKKFVTSQLMEMTTNNGSTGDLGSVYWPRGLLSIPNEERTLKIGVPAKGAFTQFVNVTYDQSCNETSITGFSIDVFKAAVKRLPYHLQYVFVPFNGSYDEMVQQVYKKELDAAVGDTEIMAYRYRYVLFSQPYVESGLDMVVTVKPNKSKETWMFTDAFTKEMWLMMAAMHIFIGFIIWLMERQINEELRGLGAMLWFLVNVLFYAHREPIRHPLARIVLAPWLFIILIVTTSFTASLTSTMTIRQLEPSVLDIETLKRTNAPVGCNGNSFIVKYLTEVLKFKHKNIRRIDSISDYPTAFKNKDIEAAFLVAPHAKVFLATYSCTGYIKAGNAFKLGGFGFAFPKGSTLAGDISEAVLDVIESGEIQLLEDDMISTVSCSSSESKTKQEDGSYSLGVQPFLGLFCISATIAVLAWLYSIKGLVVSKLGNLMNHIQETSSHFRIIWRWARELVAQTYSKFKIKIMRNSTAAEINNPEETASANEQNPTGSELVHVVMIPHAPN